MIGELLLEHGSSGQSSQQLSDGVSPVKESGSNLNPSAAKKISIKRSHLIQDPTPNDKGALYFKRSPSLINSGWDEVDKMKSEATLKDSSPTTSPPRGHNSPFKHPNIKKIQISSTQKVLSGWEILEEEKKNSPPKAKRPILVKSGTIGNFSPSSAWSNNYQITEKTTLSRLRTKPGTEQEANLDSPPNRLSNFELILQDAFKDLENLPKSQEISRDKDNISPNKGLSLNNESKVRQHSPSRGQVFSVKSMSKYLDICNKAKRIIGNNRKNTVNSDEINILSKISVGCSPDRKLPETTTSLGFQRSEPGKVSPDQVSISPQQKTRSFKISQGPPSLSRLNSSGHLDTQKSPDSNAQRVNFSMTQIPSTIKQTVDSSRAINNRASDVFYSRKTVASVNFNFNLAQNSKKLNMSPVRDSSKAQQNL